MVLVASFTVPANAVSWTVVNPADYISSTRRENGIDYVSFNFNLSPLVEYSLSGVSGDTLTGTANKSVSLDIDHSYHLPATLQVYPLGKKYIAYSKLTSVVSGQIAIDVHDFKPSAAVTVNAHIYLHLDYIYDSAVNASSSDYLGLDSSFSFYEYDANGNCLGCLEDTKSGVYPLAPQSTQATFSVPLQKTFELSSMHENTRYIVPFFTVNFRTITNSSEIDLRRVEFSSEAFYIETQTDMLLKNSLTLDTIEKQLEDLNDKTDSTNEKLDDLNDKADTIISGTPEMGQSANNSSNRVQDFEGERNQIEELEKEYLDDFEASSDTLNDKVSQFVDGIGFTQLTALVLPIMDWQHSGLIMLLIIAFINMSIIMFGR